MPEMITVQEAGALGLSKGRLNYLIENGNIKKEVTFINNRKRIFVDKASVLKYAKTSARTPVKPRDPFDLRKSIKPKPAANELAIIALGVCAQLMKHEKIKAKFKGATVMDLLNAADEIGNK